MAVTWVDVEAEYHQFFISPIDADPSSVADVTDVFGAGDDVIVVRTGVASGPVKVGLAPLATEPTRPLVEWENVAQVTLTARQPLHVISVQGDVADFAPIEAPTSGFVAVRVSTRGRSLHWDADVESWTEQYLVEVWPASEPSAAKQLRSVDGMWRPAKRAASTRRRPKPSDPFGDLTRDATVELSGPTVSYMDEDGVWRSE